MNSHLSQGNCEEPTAGPLQRTDRCTPPLLTLRHHHPPHPHKFLGEVGAVSLPQTPPLLQGAGEEEHLKLKEF